MARIYKKSIALQRQLDQAQESLDLKLDFARIYLDEINKQWDSLQPRAARSSCAYFIDDKLTTDSLMSPSQKFGEVILKGTVPRIGCINISGRLVVALPFFDAVVLGPVQEIESGLVDYELDECDTILPLEVPIRRPLFTPVENIGFIALAA